MPARNLNEDQIWQRKRDREQQNRNAKGDGGLCCIDSIRESWKINFLVEMQVSFQVVTYLGNGRSQFEEMGSSFSLWHMAATILTEKTTLDYIILLFQYV